MKDACPGNIHRNRTTGEDGQRHTGLGGDIGQHEDALVPGRLAPVDAEQANGAYDKSRFGLLVGAIGYLLTYASAL